jgi:hypothetical protein
LNAREADVGARPGRSWRPIAGAALCGVAATLMFTGAAAGGASNRAATAAACSPLQETVRNGTPSAKLLAILGVLRRPQTANDALPASLNPVWGDAYVKFIRRARVVAGTAYYLVPVAAQDAYCRLSDEVVLVTVEPLGQSAGGGLTVGRIEHGGLVGTRWLGSSGVQYGVVPDTVAKVTLRYPPGRRGLRDTVTVAPVDNVYVATVPPAARGSVLPVLPSVVVWRSRKGSVLKTFHSP